MRQRTRLRMAWPSSSCEALIHGRSRSCTPDLRARYEAKDVLRPVRRRLARRDATVQECRHVGSLNAGSFCYGLGERAIIRVFQRYGIPNFYESRLSYFDIVWANSDFPVLFHLAVCVCDFDIQNQAAVGSIVQLDDSSHLRAAVTEAAFDFPGRFQHLNGHRGP